MRLFNILLYQKVVKDDVEYIRLLELGCIELCGIRLEVENVSIMVKSKDIVRVGRILMHIQEDGSVRYLRTKQEVPGKTTPVLL